MVCINATVIALPLSRIKHWTPLSLCYTSLSQLQSNITQPVYQGPLGVHSIHYHAGINTTLHLRCVPGTGGLVTLGGTGELVRLGGTGGLVRLGGTGGLVRLGGTGELVRFGGTQELVRLGVTSTARVTVIVVVMVIASGDVISA